jgi:hypothetical protein
MSKPVVIVRAPAHLRRERRWVHSVFGGEFNAALVAPFNSQSDETWLPERSAGLGERSGGAVRSH